MNRPHLPTRTAGAHARQRLLEAALRLFAAKGYRQSSTRVIADSAGVNLGAISYYFGDKAGLYRAVFCESFCDASEAPDIATARACLPDATERGAEAALVAFFRNFLQPLKLGEQIRLVMRLHFRELIEPSGVLDGTVDDDIGALYAALVALVAAELGTPDEDPEARRLAHAILALAFHFFVSRDLVDKVSPELLATPEAIETLAERLGRYAAALLAAEARTSKPAGAAS